MMINTQRTQNTQHTAPDSWRDVWSDDREANRIAARIAQSRDDAEDMAQWLAAARNAIS